MMPRPSRSVRPWTRRVVAVLLLGLLAGCSRGVIRGTVVDIRGEELPGVAVTVEGREFEDLTDARGTYAIRYAPGSVVLRFAKSGYTPAELSFSVDEMREIDADPVQLWRVPAKPGVYLFEDFDYRETTRVDPDQFFMPEGDVIFGTQREPELTTTATQPLVVCYKTPRYDARLSRLKQVEARLSAADAHLYRVWRAAGTVPAGLVPLDKADERLLSLELGEPLEPGTYAVEWGALDGYTTLERRIYMFSVEDPEAESPEDGASESSAGAEGDESSESDAEGADGNAESNDSDA